MKYNVGTMKYFLVGYMGLREDPQGKSDSGRTGGPVYRFWMLILSNVKIGVSLKFLLRSEKPDFEG